MDPRPASDVFSDPLQVLRRSVVVVLVDAVVLWILAGILDRFTLDGFGAAIGAALLIGVLNALVFPTLARLTLPLNVLTLGFAAIVLNAILVAFAIDLVPNAEIQGLAEAIVVTIALTLSTSATSALLAIDDDESWYRNVVKAQSRGRETVNRTNVPGVLFLEIDGLAHEVLERAIASGRVPNIKRWLDDGSHSMHVWETDWSSQTGACQAGLLHGDNDDMPAFRWWEKDRNAPIVTNHPKDAVEIERRHSNGRGLLYADGASRANILSGDAAHSMLTMSTVLTRRRPIGRDYAAYFARPYATFKTFNAIVAEYFRERYWAIRQKRIDEKPRILRDRKYGLVRAWATVVQLDLQVAAVVGDLLAGRPVVYTTFLAYDEVAHHSGIEREDTLAVLEKVDRQIGRIEKATAEAPRPYRLIVLSDHGQSQGATFLQRYGYSLQELVEKACNSSSTYAASGDSAEASAYMGAGLTELDRDQTPVSRAVQVGAERLDIAHPNEEDGATKTSTGDEPPELAVMASGCLGLISFPRQPGRLTLETIEALYPTLIEELRGHEGIGFLLVDSAADGALAIGAEGVNRLEKGEVLGKDPLAPFGPNAARHVLRTHRFPHCPDIVVNSRIWHDPTEVAAFEELVGSHGGMGGSQSYPFVLSPTDLAWPDGEVIGAETVHQVFRRWLAGLGQDAYADGAGEISSAAPGSSSSAETPGASSPS
ncbi:MAG: phage holin family protein [Solirubrobacterales bacterium]